MRVTVSLVGLLTFSRHTLETFFSITYILMGFWAGYSQVSWNWLIMYCLWNRLSHFSLQAYPWVLPDTHRASGPAVWFCGATLMWVSHSFTLFQFCPCSFLHSKERKWRQHDTSAAHSHCHHTMWSKAAKEKSLFQSFFRLLCSLVTVLTSS